MKKFRNLKEDAQDNIKDDIWAAAKPLGASRYDNDIDISINRALKNKIGICSNCGNLRYCETEWGNVYARCYEFEIKLQNGNCIQRCTNYNKIGAMNLETMMDMAVLIDNNKKAIGLLTKI